MILGDEQLIIFDMKIIGMTMINLLKEDILHLV